MKIPLKVMASLVVLFSVLVLAGCIRSLHPIYRSSDVVFNKGLIGTWKQSGEETTWQFTESTADESDRAYRLVLTDEEGRPGTFLAHLVKLKGELFLDLFPIAPQVSNNGYYKFHFQRVHTFLRVTFDGETFKLATMNPKWLEKKLRNDPDALAHTLVTPSGHKPTGEEDSAGERLLLTASTAELQRFLVKHADTQGAYSDPVELKKIW